MNPFDGEFTVKNGQPQGLKEVPNKPGVYVVYNADNKPVYVGDSEKLQKRWRAGHLNDYRRGKNLGKGYKLDGPLDDGCTVRYILMNSVVTAAAVEAHLINTVDPEINARQELLTEQGKRNNIEAKKVKDASGSTTTLAKGAAIEAGINMTWGTLELIADVVIIAIKNELVDIVAGSKTGLIIRADRFLRKILEAFKGLVAEPLKLLGGLVEFVVNALSKAIGEIYMLARNLYDLANSAWNLFHSAETMSKEDLIRKISETILISGTLVFWDVMDPLLEVQLTALIAPIAPYIASAITAIGFGATSYYLRNFIPAIVTFLVNFRTGWHDALDAQRALCDQMLGLFE